MDARSKAMGSEDDLCRIDEHVAEAHRMVQRQKGLIIRIRAAGVSAWDAQRILWLLESNLGRIGGTQGPPQKQARRLPLSIRPE